LPLLTGLTALLMGALIYMTDRPPQTAWLVHALCGNLAVYGKLPPLFGALGNVLPAFLHVLAFSLITAGVMVQDKKTYAWITLFWFCVNALFELGQKFPDTVVPWIARGSSGSHLLARTTNFFSKGTFDPLDILAFAMGAFMAYALLIVMHKKE